MTIYQNTPGVIGKFLRSEEHTSELQSHSDLVCRLLLEKKKEIDRRDPPFGKRGEVIGPVPPGEETSMDGGVQGLEPVVEEFGYPGYLRLIGNHNTRCGQ